MKKWLLTLLAISTSALGYQTSSKNTDPINTIINEHLHKYAQQELFSAIQVSIKTNDKINTYTAGNRAITAGSPPITANDLFDIGSISKSFTAALALMAESDGKLKLQDTLSDYLPNYSHWGELTLTSLLNMSSGIPNYSNAPKINYLMSKNLQQYWSQSDLIDLVYSKQFNPPRKPGYFYSNTGYVLMDMILSNKYKTPFQNLLTEKIITPLALKNTFYPVPNYPTEVMQRLVRGYSYNIYDNPELLGRDVTDNNLSWAGAAGAIVANSEDVINWIEHLFIGNKLLTPAQKEKMQTLISLSSATHIVNTSEEDPYGFGLGIVQAYDADMGHYWFYEGETLGYRALYIYVPCNQVIISALFNSATNGENDHAHELIQTLYKHILQQDHKLFCKQNKTIGLSKENSA